MVAIGAGPALAAGTLEKGCFSILTACNPPPTSQSYLGLGFDARIAVTFGANKPTVRGGITLEFGFHTSPHSAMGSLGIGFDLF
jgi:hypothetical protein